MRKISWMLFSLLAMTQTWGETPSPRVESVASSPAVEQVKRINEERIRAFSRGDASAWGLHVAENCVFIESSGRLSTKAEWISGIKPTVGYTHSLEVSDVRAADFGETVVLTVRAKEIYDFGTQRTGGMNIYNATYAHLNGDWQLVSWSETLQPPEPNIARVDPRTYGRYVGVYAVNPQVRFTVTKEGNRLIGQYSGDDKFELLPSSDSTFFRHGDNTATFSFVQDPVGHVTEHVYRAEGTEIRYKKTPDSSDPR